MDATQRTKSPRRGPLLAEMRKDANVSRRSIVELSGVPFAELKQYEAGERIPSDSVVRRISLAIVTATAKAKVAA